MKARTTKKVKPNNKIKYSVYREFEFDFTKELDRLHSCFKGAQLKRQLKLIDLFCAGKFEALDNAFDKLPYCKKEHCPEQEFVGAWYRCFGSTTNNFFYQWGTEIPVKKFELTFPLNSDSL